MLLDDLARDTALECIYGPTRAAGAPDSFIVRLYDDHPLFDGAEIADTTETEAGTVPNGYAPGTVDSDDMALDEFGMVVPVTFPDALEAYPVDVKFWVLEDPVTGAQWNTVALDEPLAVTSAGPFPNPVTLRIAFAEQLDQLNEA